MDPQRPSHQAFTRPSAFTGSQETRNASLPARLYGQGSSLANGQSQPPYDPLRRRDSDLSSGPAPPPPSLGYPSHPFPHDIISHPKSSQAPGSLTSLHPEAPPTSLHARQPSRGSIIKHSDGGSKEVNSLYRDGKISFFVVLRLSHVRVTIRFLWRPSGTCIFPSLFDTIDWD